MSDAHVRSVQRWYPQIYLTCHTRHQRAASTGVGLSAHDSSVLAHLDEAEPVSASQLARHLSIGAPTLSATLNRLVKLGYVARTRAAADRRVMEVRLSASGARAMQASSVLDADRVAAVLDALTPDERTRALDGLGLLARAARAVSDRPGGPRRDSYRSHEQPKPADRKAADAAPPTPARQPAAMTPDDSRVAPASPRSSAPAATARGRSTRSSTSSTRSSR